MKLSNCWGNANERRYLWGPATLCHRAELWVDGSWQDSCLKNVKNNHVCFCRWLHCSITCNAAVILWSIHDDLASVLCDVSRAYIKRITDSQKGKPHVQESDLQEACTPFCFASLHVWYCASFLWHLVILCGTPVCSFPSALMTHDSVSTESGKRWREQAPWH